MIDARGPGMTPAERLADSLADPYVLGVVSDLVLIVGGLTGSTKAEAVELVASALSAEQDETAKALLVGLVPRLRSVVTLLSGVRL